MDNIGQHFLHARCMWFCHARRGKNRHHQSFSSSPIEPKSKNGNVGARVLAIRSGAHTLYSVDFELDLHAVELCRVGAAERSNVCLVAALSTRPNGIPSIGLLWGLGFLN